MATVSSNMMQTDYSAFVHETIKADHSTPLPYATGIDNKYPDMQAIFLAHGPLARMLKNVGKGFVSHDPPVLHSTFVFS